ncbi:MAG TPA: glycosyltransferase [Acidimicrobiales bacterium]|nr:glycosyltransferase [Acidimicrobiales bacterium]
MDRLVSVVVPVGRVDQALRVQLDAVRAQELDAPVEVVLARNTAEAADVRALDALVDDLGDRRFRVVDASDVRGASHARNVGAAAAGGAVLAFCDSDDVVHPGWLAAITGALDDLDAAGGRIVDVGLTERHRQARPAMTPDALPTFFGVPYMGSGNMAITREAFDDVGGFDESLDRCEDIALSWSLLVAGRRIGFASDAVIDYHHRPGTLGMVKQHVAYGRGMAQVLARYGVPDDGGWRRPRGLALLKPNPRPMVSADEVRVPAAQGSGDRSRRSLLGMLRRGSLAAGRLWGLIEERAWTER